MHTVYERAGLIYSKQIFVIQRCWYCFKIYRPTQAGPSIKIPDLEKFPPEKIRNFGIVAHVDHGKSTLADRLLTLTNVIKSGEREQFLDKLQVERERGITVKAQTCTMVYKGHLLNLIDTPGHVDFNFEVTRSLAAVNGILLLVAANEGIKAQTKANFKLAFERDLTILPVINKIDMKNANIPKVSEEMSTLGFTEEEIMRISAKSGENVPEVLNRIIDDIPHPSAKLDAPFRALVFDSWFSQKRGGIPLILVKEGIVKPRQKIRSYHKKMEYEVSEVGIMYPEMQPCEALYAGQVGYIICNMKTTQEAGIGETVFEPSQKDRVRAFPGFKPNQPTVYAGLYPVDTNDYEKLKAQLNKLMLNDSSVTMDNDSSPILGHGFKLGFLGILHMEVFGQRLKDEYDADVILTAPNVKFMGKIVDNESVKKKRYNGASEIYISDPSKYPEFPTDIEYFFEPITRVTLDFPSEYVGGVIKLCQSVRGVQIENSMLNDTRTSMTWDLPDSEIMISFFDKMMSLTSGEVKYDQEHAGYKEVDLIKINITVNGKAVNEFSMLSPKNEASKKGSEIEIPRQQYEVEIKAHIGTQKKAVSTQKIPALKKDFSSKLKGNFGNGRADKKLKEQREGKERLKMIGNVQVPKEAFINILRRDF